MPNTRRRARRRSFRLLRIPLLRLLAINLAIGACAAALLVGGLLWLNPGHLRELILADRAPGIGLALLLASFVITFGSAAMGSAIMAQGRKQEDDRGDGGSPSRLAAQKLPRRARPM
ncbi:hypothetical protein JQ612_24980 [Bradyrhizobium manausense]|uniref:hypothetical protein n=1 Tax=Bradyrhizobium manausense TaxID=989370 RepID=UPI001BA4E846|nr:hypothetical protein [Bradyrhizobium manausense]